MTPREYLRRTDMPVEAGLCFVVMPFGDEMDSIYNAGIRPAIETLGMTPLRIDESFRSVSIMDEILASILRAEIIIADLTGKNPNVFYELGLAHAVKAHVILIAQSLDDIPFDLQGIRCFKYENTMAGARTLAEVLEKTIRPMRAAPTAHSADIEKMQDLLQKGFNAWFGMGDIVLERNEYLAIVRNMDELALDDEHASFLAAAAAYFGRHMARMIARVRQNRAAIRALATYIAQTPMQRPAWRAAAMLERCEIGTVREETATVLASGVLDDERRRLLQDIIPRSGVMEYLRHLSASPDLPDSVCGNADEAIRQITAEFGLAGTENPDNGG